MNDDSIERIWKQAPAESPLSRQELVAALSTRIDRGARILVRYVWTYLLVQLATLGLVGLNLVAYRANSTMVAVELGVGAAALAFLVHALRLRSEVRGLERLDEALEDALRRRLAFYGAHAKGWICLAALSLVAFNFALNSWIDRAGGSFTINHPFVFVLVQVATVVIFVASFWLAHAPHLRQIRAVLVDLEAQLLDRTAAVDVNARRLRPWRLAIVVLLGAFLALGAWMAWRAV